MNFNHFLKNLLLISESVSKRLSSLWNYHFVGQEIKKDNRLEIPSKSSRVSWSVGRSWETFCLLLVDSWVCASLVGVEPIYYSSSLSTRPWTTATTWINDGLKIWLTNICAVKMSVFIHLTGFCIVLRLMSSNCGKLRWTTARREAERDSTSWLEVSCSDAPKIRWTLQENPW